jgi:hypothetical protein
VFAPRPPARPTHHPPIQPNPTHPLTKHKNHPNPLNTPQTQEDYRRWVELVYAGDVGDFHGMRLRRYVFSQEDFRNDSALAPDFYHDNLPTCVRARWCFFWVCVGGGWGLWLCGVRVCVVMCVCLYNE